MMNESMHQRDLSLNRYTFNNMHLMKQKMQNLNE